MQNWAKQQQQAVRERMKQREAEEKERDKEMEEFMKQNPKPAEDVYCDMHPDTWIERYEVIVWGRDNHAWSKKDRACPVCESIAENLSKARIPSRYQQVPVGVKYADILKSGKGILFTGGVGTGKTYELASAMKWLLGEGEAVRFRTFGDICRNIRDSIGKKNYSEVYREWFSEDIFVVDDLGVENSTSFIQEFVYNLINDYYNWNKRLLITTNLTSQELVENYGQRVVSRLSEMCEIVNLEGNDRRRKAVTNNGK